MDTGTVILIAIAALAIIALLALIPRISGKRRLHRQVERRREEKVEQHRSVAETKMSEADRLEAAARAERAEAEAHAQHASVHERGLADDELHREVVAEREGEGGGRFTREPDGDTVHTPPKQI